MSCFIISTRSNGELQFNLIANNGKVILTSEGYVDRSNCQNGIASVKKNAILDDAYVRKISTNKKHYFNLKAANGQIIGTSELYESAQAMEVGIASVKKNAIEAILQEG